MFTLCGVCVCLNVYNKIDLSLRCHFWSRALIPCCWLFDCWLWFLLIFRFFFSLRFFFSRSRKLCSVNNATNPIWNCNSNFIRLLDLRLLIAYEFIHQSISCRFFLNSSFHFMWFPYSAIRKCFQSQFFLPFFPLSFTLKRRKILFFRWPVTCTISFFLLK